MIPEIRSKRGRFHQIHFEERKNARRGTRTLECEHITALT